MRGMRNESEPGASDGKHLGSPRPPRLVAEHPLQFAGRGADGNREPTAGVQADV